MPWGLKPGEKRPAHWKPTGLPPAKGRSMARTWALVYGTAWVSAAELMEPPGIFCDYKYLQSCQRAMMRCGIEWEHMWGNGIKLYRFSPETVAEILKEDQ